MKIKLQNNLKDYRGLTSSAVFSYVIATSPLITILLALVSVILTGENGRLGTLSFLVLIYPIIFVIMFLSLDLYPIITKQRNLGSLKTTIKTSPELFILLAFIVWNIIATILQIVFFGESKALTTIIYPLGVQEGLYAFIAYALCLLCAYFVKSEKIVKNLLCAFTLSLCILSIFAFINPTNTFFFQNHHNTQWAGMFFNSNHFGYVLTLATTLSGIGFILLEKRWEKITSLGLLALFCATSFMVDTLGSLIGIFVTFIIMPIFLSIKNKKFKWEYLIPIVTFLILSFALIPLGNGTYYSTYKSFCSQLVDLVKDFIIVLTDIANPAPSTDIAKQAGTNRWELWLDAFAQIKKSPIIGSGDVMLRPHNEYLQYAQVWGLPSTLIYVSAFIVILVKAIKHTKKLSNLTLCLIFPVIAYLISALFGNTMPHTTPFFALFLGLLIRSINEDITRKNSKNVENCKIRNN